MNVAQRFVLTITMLLIPDPLLFSGETVKTTMSPTRQRAILNRCESLLFHEHLSRRLSIALIDRNRISVGNVMWWQQYNVTDGSRKQVQSNLGSRTRWIMNNSVYEQIFRTQSVSDDVLCLELRTRNPSTSWSDKLAVSVFHFLTTFHLRRQLSSIQVR